MLSLNEKLSEVQLLCFTNDLSCIASILFICKRKFYACMHVKITCHWKSTLNLEVGMGKGGTQHSATSQICSQVKIFHLQNHGQKSWETCISWVFSNSHMPNPSPHPTNNIGCLYPEFFPSFFPFSPRVRMGEASTQCSICKV